MHLSSVRRDNTEYSTLHDKIYADIFSALHNITTNTQEEIKFVPLQIFDGK